MPHFVVDCSENILTIQDADKINQEIHQAANSTGLFSEANIQVRISPFSNNLLGGKKAEFIQVYASILEGRTPEQKLALSKTVITALAELFPTVEQIAMSIRDVEKGTGYSKKSLLQE